MDVKQLIAKYEQSMIDDLAKLISIDSTMGEAQENAPFGIGPKKALDEALLQCDNLGFKTKNIDNYAGYAEIGEGEQLVGVLAHLDVVPVGDGWNTNPFELTIKDNVMYGRGVSDDKGAAIASMYALKIIKDLGIPLNKRVRLILGTNEESGSLCLKHYVEKEGHIDLGFTPDGNFPGVFGEKGSFGGRFYSKNTKIKDIQGGHTVNIVCDDCTIKIEKNSYSCKKLQDYFNNLNIKYSIEEDNNDVVINVKGVAAHASRPSLGVNAISHLLNGLKQAGFQDPFVDYYLSHIGINNDGEGLGLKISDQYGSLTLNNGIIKMEDGVISGSIDIRYPVTYTAKQILELVDKYLDSENGYIEVVHVGEPLFFQVDSPLVSALVKAYRSVTNDNDSQPMTMGGGTYAKGINNCIAFGCGFPDVDYHIHDANEFLPIEELKLQTEIYVEAIKNLLEV
ncbi:MAG: dipeptidase PepV [Erysipelotrichaceae bacterium]|nr:dipeptidase PepV [Erysipelotrichaceae bacterium]